MARRQAIYCKCQRYGSSDTQSMQWLRMAMPWQLIDVRKQTLKQASLQEYPKGTMRIQVPIDSRNSAIQHAYHTLLHPSSSSQPRHPMLKIVVTNRVNSPEGKKGYNEQTKHSNAQTQPRETAAAAAAAAHTAMADIPECMCGGSKAAHPHIRSQHQIIVLLS